MKKVLALLLICTGFVACNGCKTATTVQPPAALAPGANNLFDQVSYQSLVVAQASINSIKHSIGDDPNLAPLKAPLNQAITDYNLAMVAWKTYHAASTPYNQAAVTASISKVQTDINGLQKGAN